MRFVAAAAAAVAALSGVASAHAATYYVSPRGRDSNSGLSQSTPWRTVSQVNRAQLTPGDRVLFAGGAVFTDTTLMPSASGSLNAPIVYGSYGPGHATLNNPDAAVWLNPGASNLVFTGLNLTSAGGPSAAFASSLNGAGSTGITLRNCRIFDTAGAGLISAKHGDANWTVENDTITNTGDSGIIALGADITINHDTIINTGWSKTITWGKHGIYAKGPGMLIENTTIRGFTGDGISLRFNGDTAKNNTISGGPIGVAYFEYAQARGTVQITGNRISSVTAAGIYIDNTTGGDGTAPTHQSFTVTGNRIGSGHNVAIDIRRTTGNVTVIGNRISGSGLSLRLERPDGQLQERGNRWTDASPEFALDGRWYTTLRAWQQTSLGAGDRVR